MCMSLCPSACIMNEHTQDWNVLLDASSSFQLRPCLNLLSSPLGPRVGVTAQHVWALWSSAPPRSALLSDLGIGVRPGRRLLLFSPLFFLFCSPSYQEAFLQHVNLLLVARLLHTHTKINEEISSNADFPLSRSALLSSSGCPPSPTELGEWGEERRNGEGGCCCCSCCFLSVSAALASHAFHLFLSPCSQILHVSPPPPSLSSVTVYPLLAPPSSLLQSVCWCEAKTAGQEQRTAKWDGEQLVNEKEISKMEKKEHKNKDCCEIQKKLPKASSNFVLDWDVFMKCFQSITIRISYVEIFLGCLCAVLLYWSR